MIFDYTFTMSFLVRNRLLSYFVAHIKVTSQARIQNFFKGGGGGLGGESLKEKCLLIVISTRVYITIRQTCSSLSSSFSRGLSSIFCFVLLLFFIFEIWKGGCNPRNPPVDPPMHPFSRHSRTKRNGVVTLMVSQRFCYLWFLLPHLLRVAESNQCDLRSDWLLLRVRCQ